MTAKHTFFALLLGMTLISCGTTIPVSSGKYSEAASFKINRYNGCCDCYAKYINIYDGKKLQAQIIYEYNCYRRGMPTKYMFNYNKRGKLLYCDKYIATVNNDFTIAINKDEQQFFTSLDKQVLELYNDTTISLLDIKGFKKPDNKEVTQVFPLVRHGTKVNIR